MERKMKKYSNLKMLLSVAAVASLLTTTISTSAMIQPDTDSAAPASASEVTVLYDSTNADSSTASTAAEQSLATEATAPAVRPMAAMSSSQTDPAQMNSAVANATAAVASAQASLAAAQLTLAAVKALDNGK
jgi:hypothetical protein